MDAQQILSQATSAVSASRVYGEPFERNGVVVIPAASVRGLGGGGGGEGGQPDGGTGSGSGLGLGFRATPVGAYVIRGEAVEWKPAVDTTSIVLRAQAAAILLLAVAPAQAPLDGLPRLQALLRLPQALRRDRQLPSPVVDGGGRVLPARLASTTPSAWRSSRARSAPPCRGAPARCRASVAGPRVGGYSEWR